MLTRCRRGLTNSNPATANHARIDHFFSTPWHQTPFANVTSKHFPILDAQAQSLPTLHLQLSEYLGISTLTAAIIHPNGSSTNIFIQSFAEGKALEFKIPGFAALQIFSCRDTNGDLVLQVQGDAGQHSIYLKSSRHIYVPKLKAAGQIFLDGSKYINVLNIQAGPVIVLRTPGAVYYDLSKLSAAEVELQVSKVAYMKFPNNVDSADKFACDVSSLPASVSYVLIGDDNSDIELQYQTCFKTLIIEAENNHLVIGSATAKGSIYGDKLLLNVKSLKVNHGVVFARETNCIQASAAISVGEVNYDQAVQFGQQFTSKPAYVGANKFLALQTSNVTLHQASLIVPQGMAWLRAEKFDNIGGSVLIAKDAYWDVRDTTHRVIYADLAAGPATRVDLGPVSGAEHVHYKITQQARIVKSQAPVMMVHGNLHVAPHSRINKIGGVTYAQDVYGVPVETAESIEQIHLWIKQFRGGHKHYHRARDSNEQHLDHKVTYVGAGFTSQTLDATTLNHLYLAANCVVAPEINAFILLNKTAIDRLQLLADAFLPEVKAAEPPVLLDPGFVQAIVAPGFSSSTALTNYNQAHKLEAPNKLHTAILDMALYSNAIKLGVSVPQMPTVLDEHFLAGIKEGNIRKVARLLRQGANINAVDTSTPELFAPLQLALSLGFIEIASYLASLPGIDYRYLTSGETRKSTLDIAREKLGLDAVGNALLQTIASKTVQPFINPAQHPLAIARESATISHMRDREILAARFYVEAKKLLKDASDTVLREWRIKLAEIEQNASRGEANHALFKDALASCTVGDVGAIQRLYDTGDDFSWDKFCDLKPLLRAIKANNIEAAVAMIDKGVGYLELLNNTDASAYAQLAANANFAAMDLSEDGILSHMVARMEQVIVNNAQETGKQMPDRVQLRIALAVYAHLLIERAQALDDVALENAFNAAVSGYVLNHDEFYTKQKNELQAIYSQLADQYLQEFNNIMQAHAEQIAANAKFYIDALADLTRRFQEAERRAREQAEAAMRKAKKKGLLKTVFAVGCAIATAWIFPQLTAYLMEAGMSELLATVGSGTILGAGNAAATGNNVAKGAISGGVMAFAGYKLQELLRNAKMVTPARIAVHSVAISGVNSLVNRTPYLQNLAASIAGEGISAIVKPTNLDNLPRAVAEQVVTSADEVLKVLLISTPALLVGNGNLHSRLMRFALQVGQTSAGRIGHARTLAATNTQSVLFSQTGMSYGDTVETPEPKQQKVPEPADSKKAEPKAVEQPSPSAARGDSAKPVNIIVGSQEAKPRLDSSSKAAKSSIFQAAFAGSEDVSTDCWNKPASVREEAKAMSDILDTVDRGAFGHVRNAKQAVAKYFERSNRVYEQVCAQQGLQPNLTSIAYAAHGLVRAGMSIIPETSRQAVFDVSTLLAAKPLLFTAKAAASVGRQLYYVNKLGPRQGAFAFAFAEELGAASVSRGYTSSSVLPRMLRASTNMEMQVGYARGVLYVPQKLTRGQIVEYLSAIESVPIPQLVEDLRKLGFELYRTDLISSRGIYKFKHTNEEGIKTFFIELHPSHFNPTSHMKNACKFDHMHITDRSENVYDRHLNNLTAKIIKENPSFSIGKAIDKSSRMEESHIKITDIMRMRKGFKIE